jgi:tetratricopeptide (TPR) repeat protein
MGKRLAYVIAAAALVSLTLLEGQTAAPTVPASIRPLFGRGLTYYRNGDGDRAIGVFDEVIRLQPTFAEAYVTRGSAYQLKGQLHKALADFDQAIRLDPKSARAYCDRADLEHDLFNQPDKALADYNEAIRLAPNFQRAYYNRGTLFIGRHNYDRAIADLTRAIQLAPSDLSAYSARAEAYLRKGDRTRAISDAKVTIKLKPAEMRLTRGVHLCLRAKAYEIIGQPELALHDFRQAARLMPNNASIENRLAWFLATRLEDRFRNGREAVFAAKNACELSHWKNSEYIDTLAAAYAETGDFEQAIKYEKQALNDSSLGPRQRGEREKRLALFEQRKPFREDLAANP